MQTLAWDTYLRPDFLTLALFLATAGWFPLAGA